MKFRLAALLLIFFSTAALANHSLVYNIVDTSKKDSIPPQFPGGMNLFYEYLKTNIKYPVLSRLKGVQGKVVVKFVVDSTGQVSKVKISNGLDKYCNEEALRIIRLSPKWIPGDINGKRADFLYNIPLSFKDTISIAGAGVMINGNLLRNYKTVKKTDLNKMPFYIMAPDLAKAIFGAKYNKKLVVFNDSAINLKGYDEAHFKNTFNMFQAIDTGKVQLNISEKVSSFNTWRQYLNKDSILGIFIYPASTYRTLDKNKLGSITLITKAGLDRQKKVKSSLIESIIAYRNGTSPLRKEMILIDEYHYNSVAIFNRIDTHPNIKCVVMAAIPFFRVYNRWTISKMTYRKSMGSLNTSFIKPSRNGKKLSCIPL